MPAQPRLPALSPENTGHRGPAFLESLLVGNSCQALWPWPPEHSPTQHRPGQPPGELQG